MDEPVQEVRQRVKKDPLDVSHVYQELDSGKTLYEKDAAISPSTGSSDDGKNRWDVWSTIRDEFSGFSHQLEKSKTGNLNGSVAEKEKKKKKKEVVFELPRLDDCCSIQTPMRRRLQTAVVAWHISAFIFLAVLALYALSNPLLWFLSVPYTMYYLFDRSPGNGGVVDRGSYWFRSLPLWNYYCEYFPIKLVKTADLRATLTKKVTKDDEKHKQGRRWPAQFVFHLRSWNITSEQDGYQTTGPRYIFGYHPHGIGALGAFGAFGTEGCEWSKKFPGINVSLMTLVTQFHVPLYREYLLALGISAVSRKNILKVLARDHSICIVVGGARESLLSSMGSVDLVLKRRKGFIKLALESGNVSLVPVFGFGETDCYKIFKTSENSYSRKLQLWIKRNYGFTIPLFYARGLFNYDFGFLPFRKPITVVTGKPIFIEKQILNPTSEQLDHYHKLYIEELERLYYDNREKYGYAGVELKILG